MQSKIKDVIELQKIVDDLKKKNKIIVTTNGAFDLFHYGHLKSLQFAKSKGDILIVCLNSDSSIKAYKSDKRPIIPEKERSSILAALECVDYVILFDDLTPIRILGLISPMYHVKGSEYKDNISEREIIEKNGGEIIFFNRDKEDVSTTKIIDKILNLNR